MTTVTTTSTTTAFDDCKPQPYTPAELDGVRSTLRYFDSTSVVARLVATVDGLVAAMVRDAIAADAIRDAIDQIKAQLTEALAPSPIDVRLEVPT